ncbi:MAG: hypothetical protein MJ246_08605 [Clostridia bacterium]|nr:hypothetical protein [Clostridia bacterium]
MLELMWDMFKYTNSETGKTEIYAETLYDVLITDDIELVNDKSLSLESDIKFDQEIDDISSDSMSRFYKSYLTTVRDREGSIKSYSVADLKENQIYYARVLGKIVTNSQTLVSEPSTISFYITPTGALYMPAVLPKPPLQKREITSTSISFEWNRAWYEVVHTDPTNTAEVHEWTSKIYSYDGHNFATLKEAEIYAGPNNIERVTTTDVSTAAAANMWVSNHAGYVFRQVGFGDDQTHYEAVILQNNNATLAELERLVESYDKSTNGWQDITVYTDPTNNEIL